ncbi:MAG: nuclease-related domain-containing protein [Trebonia sp.]
MRTVVLSDHPDDMLSDEIGKRRQRASEQEAVLSTTVRDREEARARGRWLRWLRLAFRAGRERRELVRRRMFSQVPTHKEDSIRAGRDAERRVAADLGCALDDDWVLFRGYRNRRGEIDGILLGPRGLLAYEVKYHNGTVYISGDEWLSERFDKYGNLVRNRAPMQGSRSPSLQLSEPAAALADWLGKRGQQIAITPVVLLAHERSRIGAIRNPTVKVATSVEDLLRLAGRPAAKLGPGRRAAIEKIIRDDHRHHDHRARSRRMPAG